MPVVVVMVAGGDNFVVGELGHPELLWGGPAGVALAGLVVAATGAAIAVRHLPGRIVMIVTQR